MGTAVPDDHLPLLCLTLAPAPMPRWPPLAGRRYPGRPQHPPHARARYHQPFYLGQLLLKVLVVEPRVLPSVQLHDLLAHALGNPIPRPPPAVAVNHTLGSALGHLPADPPHLARRQAE